MLYTMMVMNSIDRLITVLPVPVTAFSHTVAAGEDWDAAASRELAEEGAVPGLSLPKPNIPWRAAPAGPGNVEELERLAKLRADDLLTEDEYSAAKARALAGGGD